MRLNALFGGLLFAATLAVTASPSAFAESQNSNQTNSTTVKVQQGDTLSKIAQTHSTTYVRLFDANLEIQHPDVIYPGNVVRIPSADETLTSRALPNIAPTPVAAVEPEVTPQPAPVAAVEQSVAPAPAAEVAVPAPTPAPEAVVSSNAGVWDQLAQCESGGNWAINTGNGFYGGLQFTLSSWQAVGGSGYPHQASKAEQIARAEQLLALQGWGAWPACTAKLGLR